MNPIYLFKYMVIAKMLTTKQNKEECMYHKQLVERLEKYPDYQQLTTNKLNQILHQTSELSAEYILRRINEKADEANAPKYKIVPASYADQSEAKREKSTIRVTNQGSRLYDS